MRDRSSSCICVEPRFEQAPVARLHGAVSPLVVRSDRPPLRRPEHVPGSAATRGQSGGQGGARSYLHNTNRLEIRMHSYLDRLRYLQGNRQCDTSTNIVQSRPTYNAPFVFTCGGAIKLDDVPKKERRFFAPYLQDMQFFCRESEKQNHSYVVQFGDRPTLAAYALTKSRKIPGRCSMLLPFNRPRHWKFKYIPGETPWAEKKEEIVWRGVTTGRRIRKDYVTALSARYNVKFTAVVQHKHDWITNKHMMGKPLKALAILKYKYVLVLPGNDVATSLKWLMQQQSVIVMPPPRVEGWLMEGLLVPYKHYVPIHSPHKMSSVLAWMRSNDDKCREIAKNAQRWYANVKSHFPMVKDLLQTYDAFLSDGTLRYSIASTVNVSYGAFDR